LGDRRLGLQIVEQIAQIVAGFRIRRIVPNGSFQNVGRLRAEGEAVIRRHRARLRVEPGGHAHLILARVQKPEIVVDERIPAGGVGLIPADPRQDVDGLIPEAPAHVVRRQFQVDLDIVPHGGVQLLRRVGTTGGALLLKQNCSFSARKSSGSS